MRSNGALVSLKILIALLWPSNPLKHGSGFRQTAHGWFLCGEHQRQLSDLRAQAECCWWRKQMAKFRVLLVSCLVWPLIVLEISRCDVINASPCFFSLLHLKTKFGNVPGFPSKLKGNSCLVENYFPCFRVMILLLSIMGSRAPHYPSIT